MNQYKISFTKTFFISETNEATALEKAEEAIHYEMMALANTPKTFFDTIEFEILEDDDIVQ